MIWRQTRLNTGISNEVTMTNILSRRNLSLLLFALSTALILALSVTSTSAQQAQQQTETQQAPANQDPLTELAKDLSPEQRQQIRLAVESTKADRNAASSTCEGTHGDPYSTRPDARSTNEAARTKTGAKRSD